jgi:hypothetical protein
MPISDLYVNCGYWVDGYAEGDEYCAAIPPTYVECGYWELGYAEGDEYCDASPIYAECDYWVPIYAEGDEFCANIITTPPPRYGGPHMERAKLVLAWMPPKKKKPKEEEKLAVVEDAIEQALEAAPVAPLVSPYEIELAAKLLLAEYGLAELRRIKYAETLLLRIEQVMAEIDDEDVILLSLN